MQRFKAHIFHGRSSDIAPSIDQASRPQPDRTSASHSQHEDMSDSDDVSARSQQWHRTITESRDVLSQGKHSAQQSALEQLSRETEELLLCETVGATAARDIYLTKLVKDHRVEDPSSVHVAVLASIASCSAALGKAILETLAGLGAEQFLECIYFARQLNNLAVSDWDYECGKHLLNVANGYGSHENFRDFKALLSCIASIPPTSLISLDLVEQTIGECGFRHDLQLTVKKEQDDGRLLSLYETVQGLVHGLRTGPQMTIDSLLMRLLPGWVGLRVWKPDIDRITLWDQGPCPKDQRTKLLPFFSLDGPDTYSQRESSLLHADAAGYNFKHSSFRSRQAATHLLELLAGAYTKGVGAIKLFIFLCVDNAPTDTELAIMESALSAEDSFCEATCLLLDALQPDLGVLKRLGSLAKALGQFDDVSTPLTINIPPAVLFEPMLTTLSVAQEAFRRQLKQGAGDRLGLAIHQLQEAISKSVWLHPAFAPASVQQFSELPGTDEIKQLFELFENFPAAKSSFGFRIRSYLASALGSLGDGGSSLATFQNLQDELLFWQQRLETTHVDFARNLEKLPDLEHSTYIACLRAILREESYIVQSVNILTLADKDTAALKYAGFLAKRQELGQMRDDCWVQLLLHMLDRMDARNLPQIAETIDFADWQEVTRSLYRLVYPLQSRRVIPVTCIATRHLEWWKYLAGQDVALRKVMGMQTGQGGHSWIYFPRDELIIKELLETVQDMTKLPPIAYRLLPYFPSDGNGLRSFLDALQHAGMTSRYGLAILGRIFRYHDIRRSIGIGHSDIVALFSVWKSCTALTQDDLAALTSVASVVGYGSQGHRMTVTGLLMRHLMDNYGKLITRARSLERARRRLSIAYTHRKLPALQDIGIDQKQQYREHVPIPDELIDSVDKIHGEQYEITLALPYLNELQRRGFCLAQGSRTISIRVHLTNKEFCSHLGGSAPNSSHKPWKTYSQHPPNGSICTAAITQFSYGFARDLHRFFHATGSQAVTVQYVHNGIARMLAATQSLCLMCGKGMSTKAYRRPICSRDCTRAFGKAPLGVQMQPLLADIPTLDLLLSAVYCAVDEGDLPDLLRGCPIPLDQIRGVIDSMPNLETLNDTATFKTTFENYDTFSGQRRALMSWISLSFRGLLLSVPRGFKIPSMPGTIQFLLADSQHEREAAFKKCALAAPSLPSGVVFHGTRPSRLFSILTKGLKNLTNTELEANGRAMGPGVYCGDEQQTSYAYALAAGQTWKNSKLGNLRVMLGCELAAYTPPANATVHCIQDENRLLVRYIFLLGPDYTPPVRAHIEPAMKTAFASLRSGLAN